MELKRVWVSNTLMKIETRKRIEIPERNPKKKQKPKTEIKNYNKHSQTHTS